MILPGRVGVGRRGARNSRVSRHLVRHGVHGGRGRRHLPGARPEAFAPYLAEYLGWNPQGVAVDHFTAEVADGSQPERPHDP